MSGDSTQNLPKVVVESNYNRSMANQSPFSTSSLAAVSIGRFFSLQDGRVGQYLSPRVLVVRTPFRKAPRRQEACYFGFEKLSQAQKFAQCLAGFGYRFSLDRATMLTQFPYEIKLAGNVDIAGVLAYWDRLDQKRLQKATAELTATIAA
jgi:hypothetical protein